MNRVRGWCLLIAVALTLALVGCSEDDTSSPTPTVESERSEQPSTPTAWWNPAEDPDCDGCADTGSDEYACGGGGNGMDHAGDVAATVGG